MLTDLLRWKIFKILRFPSTAKDALWLSLTRLEVDIAWNDEVTAIVNRLIAADVNPNSLLGSIEDYDPGLKKLDVIEYFEGVPEAQRNQIYDRLWMDLSVLIGRDDIIIKVASDNANAGIVGETWIYGTKAGFS